MAITNQILNSKYNVSFNGNGTIGEIHTSSNYNLYWNEDMFNTFCNCQNLTTDFFNLKVNFDQVVNMSQTFFQCNNLTGSPICGPDTQNMRTTYYNCYNITGSPVCSDKVKNFQWTYGYCRNLTGSPVCGNNVTDMSSAYYACSNLTGTPVCGPNVTNMCQTYAFCSKLGGQPACGNNVTDMSYAYYNCLLVTGVPVCGPNVTNLAFAYANCYNITRHALNFTIQNKVNNIYNIFQCSNNSRLVYGNIYLLFDKDTNAKNINMANCFYRTNYTYRINLFVKKGYAYDNTLKTPYNSPSYRFIGNTTSITWKTMTNGYYNTRYNIYVYNNL